MKKWLLQSILSAVAVLFTAQILPGVQVSGIVDALLVALVLSFLNTFLKPVLLILTIPVTLLTFGLFLLVINAIIIVVADTLLNGFNVNGFGWALLFSLILSVINALLQSMTGLNQPDNKNNKLE
ncbi:MAG: phage holin family protein [Bacteroidia bacterium]|jgi:putative membrane protein